MKRFNLIVGGIEYVQDAKDKKKYHCPGGGTKTSYDLYKMAEDNKLGSVRRIQRNG
tara:strand:- start:2436 stop:2603 length:168 start_codon:yes stop_codon:yes gene_type:complete